MNLKVMGTESLKSRYKFLDNQKKNYIANHDILKAQACSYEMEKITDELKNRNK